MTKKDMTATENSVLLMAIVELRDLLDVIIDKYDAFVQLNDQACGDDLYSTTPDLEAAIEVARRTLRDKN